MSVGRARRFRHAAAGREWRVLNVVLALLLLVLLFASMMVWAVRYAARGTHGEGPTGLIGRARLSAAAVPFLVTLVLIAVAIGALLSGQGQAVDRLLAALASRPARLGLLLCTLATLLSAGLCAQVWLKGEATTGARLHLTAHVLAVCALVGVLLAASFESV